MFNNIPFVIAVQEINLKWPQIMLLQGLRGKGSGK